MLNKNINFPFSQTALASVPKFEKSAVDPIICSSISELTSPQRVQLVSKYERHGFAIIEIANPDGSDAVPSQTILGLAELFGLGEPYIPPLYKKGDYRAVALNQIAVETNGSINHPSFERTRELPLHCDGTLQELGLIKTSVLFCQSPAPRGGETVLFNGAGAFAELVRQNPETAQAFMTSGVLHRQANMNGSRETLIGPALRISEEEGVVCSYTLADTDSWHPDPEFSSDFNAGLEFMSTLADTDNKDSPYHLTFTLKKNQTILMRNTSISHGRMAYQNATDCIRILHRGLFEHHPTIVPEHA